MDIASIIQAVANIGFPAAICVYLLFREARQDERNAKQYEELRKTVSNNTKCMRELYTMVKELIESAGGDKK